jgi:type VI secretion system protein ImpB
MPESIQHKLDRVRPPRVQITYDVETAGAIVMTELPFVVGIMADLGTSDLALSADKRYDPASQNGGTPLPAQDARPVPVIKDRKYVNIDRDNFNDTMKSVGPRLSFSVNRQSFEQYKDETEKDERKQTKFRAVGEKDPNDPNKALTESVELEFNCIDDFNPINVVKQVKLLRDLLTARNLLSDLLTKLEGNDVLDKNLKKFLDAALTEDTLKKFKQAATPAAADASSADAAKPADDGKGKGGKK